MKWVLENGENLNGGNVNLKNRVVSLELAKRLKKEGYPQDKTDTNLWFWVRVRHNWEILYRFDGVEEECYAAPTVAELGEALPNCFSSGRAWNIHCDKKDKWYCESYNNKGESVREHADTEADARAKMWLYLKENQGFFPQRNINPDKE